MRDCRGEIQRIRPHEILAMPMVAAASKDALLARTHPLAVIPAAVLIGAMEAGGSMMQFKADVSPEITDIIQALILIFVATPLVVRWFLSQKEANELSVSTTWGS